MSSFAPRKRLCGGTKPASSGSGGDCRFCAGQRRPTKITVIPTTFAVDAAGALGAHVFSCLTWDPSNASYSVTAPLYAVASEPSGISTLYQIDVATSLTVTSLGVVGTGIVGGLAFGPFQLSPTGQAFHLYAISGDGMGEASLNGIALTASAVSVFDLGENFNRGFDVIGTHS